MKQVIVARWHALASRERAILTGGGGILLACLVFLLLVDPLLDRLDRAERQTIRKQKELQELIEVGARYTVLKARLATFEQRLPPADGQFSMLAFLEDAAGAVQIRDRITAMQPQTPTVTQGYQDTAIDLRLDGVPLPQLLNFLVKLEQAPYDVQVPHVQIKPKFDNPAYLEVNLRIVTYAKAR